MKEEVKTLKAEVRDVLEHNILNFWLDKMVDEENGGFYGQMTGEGEIVKTADKGGILNARILWSFSAAYRVLHKQEYLEAATRAKDYIIDHFIDKEYGGTYWSLDYKGQPKDTKKQFYAIGFTIYGLSEYARATGDREALDYAMELYECIEEHSLDREYNGYIEACTREWGCQLPQIAEHPFAHHRTLHQSVPLYKRTQGRRKLRLCARHRFGSSHWCHRS